MSLQKAEIDRLRQMNHTLEMDNSALREEVVELNHSINGYSSYASRDAQWEAEDAETLKTIEEQGTEIMELKKEIAQMKACKKLEEEILALKVKRTDAAGKNEAKILALRSEHAKTDKELEEKLKVCE